MLKWCKLKKHLVSIVIPAYNSEKSIGRCLKSIVRQNPYEVIVVDDGSTDGTAHIAKAIRPLHYPVRIIRHATNKGLAAARNTGVETAHGDIILFIDSDCEAMPGLVKTIVENYGKGADGVGGRGIETGDSKADKWRQLTGGQGYGGKRKVGVPFLFGLCSSYRRSVLIEAGLFDTTFRTNGEDVDMGLRLNKMGKTLVYAPGAKVVHYRRDTFWSLVRMVYRAYKFGYLAYLKNRGLLRTFRIFAFGVPADLFGGLWLMAAKSTSRDKLVHVGLVVAAFLAEMSAFLNAVWCHVFSTNKNKRV